jgi:hypothetical protein
MQQFQIDRQNLSKTEIVKLSDRDTAIGDGEILVQVERCGFSANNITYAVAGDTMNYWQFFKSVGDEAAKWGVLPVWGFAEVSASNVKGLDVGERLFGYFPPATHLIMSPTEVGAGHFFDSAEHRLELPKGYNIYRRVAAEPGYDRRNDDMRMLLYPLYITSFSIWDFLKEQDWYGAEQVVIVSASSKTAIGLAYALQGDDQAPDVVGITSERNMRFVESLGAYSSQMSYAAMKDEIREVPTVIVDMSGNSEFLGQMHLKLGDNMMQTVNVGLTHWDNFKPNQNIIRDRSAFFFAPSQIQKRMKEWGAAEFEKRSTGFFKDAVGKTMSWLKLNSISGIEGLSEIYPDVLVGKYPPDQGIIVEISPANKDAS